MNDAETIILQNQQLQVVEEILKELLKGNPLGIKLERLEFGQHDYDTESAVLRLADWVVIIPCFTAPKCFTSPKYLLKGSVNFIDFELGQEVVNRGVHHYADGSGEPDTMDYEKIEDHLKVYDVCKKAILTVIENDLDNHMEAIAEERRAKEPVEEY